MCACMRVRVCDDTRERKDRQTAKSLSEAHHLVLGHSFAVALSLVLLIVLLVFLVLAVTLEIFLKLITTIDAQVGLLFEEARLKGNGRAGLHMLVLMWAYMSMA